MGNKKKPRKSWLIRGVVVFFFGYGAPKVYSHILIIESSKRGFAEGFWGLAYILWWVIQLALLMWIFLWGGGILPAIRAGFCRNFIDRRQKITFYAFLALVVGYVVAFGSLIVLWKLGK